MARLSRLALALLLAAATVRADALTLAVVDMPWPDSPHADHQRVLSQAEALGCETGLHGKRMAVLGEAMVPAGVEVRVVPVLGCGEGRAAAPRAMAQAIEAAAGQGASVIAVPWRVDLAALAADYPDELDEALQTPLVAAFSIEDIPHYRPSDHRPADWHYALPAMDAVSGADFAPHAVQTVTVPRIVKTETTRYVFPAHPSAAAVVAGAHRVRDLAAGLRGLSDQPRSERP